MKSQQISLNLYDMMLPLWKKKGTDVIHAGTEKKYITIQNFSIPKQLSWINWATTHIKKISKKKKEKKERKFQNICKL